MRWSEVVGLEKCDFHERLKACQSSFVVTLDQ
jgi:hypothetical protein